MGPIKEEEPEPVEEEPQGQSDTEAESKSSESKENEIVVQASQSQDAQDEVRENVEESEPQPIVLSKSSSSAAPSASVPHIDSEDMAAKNSIMSPDRSMKYKPLPAHDVPTPLPDEKDIEEEESVEDVTPAPDHLEDVNLTMDKPLSPRSDTATDDLVSPKAQSIAEGDAATPAEDTDIPEGEEEAPEDEISNEEPQSMSQKLTGFCSKGESVSNDNAAEETQNTGFLCGCFGP